MTYSAEQLKAMCPAQISECSQKHVQSVIAELIETALAQPAQAAEDQAAHDNAILERGIQIGMQRQRELAAATQPEAQPKGIPLDIPELQDRLVAISAAVADQDDIAAQAMLGGTLRMLDVTDAATIAGLESAGGHLSALVDEAQVLLTELREYARDLEKETLGGESERGEVSLLDLVDDWLDARPAAPSAQAEQGGK